VISRDEIFKEINRYLKKCKLCNILLFNPARWVKSPWNSTEMRKHLPVAQKHASRACLGFAA